VPEAIHSKEPFFVPPFPGSIIKIFKGNSPFQQHGKLFPLIAYRDGKPVGRICATVNRAHNDHYKDKTGFFGFFDCIDDVEVARALVDAARTKLRGEGLEVMRGPYNPTINEESGLLVEGFEATPFVMMPFNPPYYMKLYEAVGMTPARDLHAFYIKAEQAVPERIGKIVERVKRTTGITVRNLDVKRLKDEIPILTELYNQTLDRNWGFVPITNADLEFAASDLKAILDPNMVLIAEKDGKPVGFSLTIPNINEFLWKARNKKGLLRILKFVWLMKTNHPKEARLAVLGVAPQFRNKGIAPVFYYETLVRGRRSYVGGELSWVEDTNTEMAKAITIMGAQKYKTYRIYEKALGGNA
jgi:hypothetical protein